jgi:hypothetical protein
LSDGCHLAERDKRLALFFGVRGFSHSRPSKPEWSEINPFPMISFRSGCARAASVRLLAVLPFAFKILLNRLAFCNWHQWMRPWTHPGSYANKLGSAPALFQYGLHGKDWVPLADVKDYVAMSSGPKTTGFYDADHALNAKARMYRDGSLRNTLNLIS